MKICFPLEDGTNESCLEFVEVPLTFKKGRIRSVFREKNNKTLRETLSHKRYSHLKGIIYEKFIKYLDFKLGDFLSELKRNKDATYKLFLNKHGDSTYSSFKIQDALKQKGIYLYSANQEIKYVGRCLDNFGKRINQGYGTIHPKNCFLDGQSTNCHLNSLIARNQKVIKFYIAIMTDNENIGRYEKLLIKYYKPVWNVALKA